MSKQWQDWLSGKDRPKREPAFRRDAERRPEHGVPNPFGDVVPHGYYDGTEPVHQPKDDDDSEPRL